MAERSPLVDLVIVNWNGGRLLQRCLEAVSAQTVRDVAVWLVDNGSTDGSPAQAQAAYPGVHLLASPTNRGFAVATNQGIRAGSAPFVATLNNDAAPEPGWLASLLAACERDPTAGAVASRMLSTSRPGAIDSAGICANQAGIFWDRFGGAPAEGPEAEAPAEIFGPCAGAALYRRAMLEQVGPFDGDFFCYLEDADLAWRARLAGWRTLYAPAARVLHAHSASLGDTSPLKSYLLGRNKVWTIVKNYPAPHFYRRLPLILAYDLAAVSYAVLAQGRWAALRGRLAGWRSLRLALRKRRTVQQLLRISPAEADRWLEPIEWPWQVAGRFRHLAPRR